MELVGEVVTPVASVLEVELELDPTVNLAMQQNDVPVIKALRLRNTSDRRLDDLLVHITSEPEFAEPYEMRIAALAPDSDHTLSPVDLSLSPSYLINLTERVAGRIHVEVLAGERKSLAKVTKDIAVLAYDEWSGLQSLPEILAAFVTPNHPEVERLLSTASSTLKDRTGDGALSGYQSKDPQRVIGMAEAVFSVIQKAGIGYINPPASYESDAQKIRLPDRILENRLGTCLDLSVLAASCLEQCGLNPLIVILDGHAFPGVWVGDDCFAECAVDDGLRLRKRVDLAEICVFESTLVCSPVAVTFDQAQASARHSLDPLGKFRCVIDIRRSRKSQIRPLPLRVDGSLLPLAAKATNATTKGPDEPDPEVSLKFSSTAEPAQEPPSAAATTETDTPATRLEKWQRRLLDLSLRNRLLNFKETKKTLRVLCSDLGNLEDALAQGEAFQIHAKPQDLDGEQLRSAELYTGRTGKDAGRELLIEEFKSRRLRIDASQSLVERCTTEIFREARSSLEEGGANILYLALGFLQWFESKSSSQPRRAPIILVPLELERKSVQEGFRIRQSDDEPRINTTLLELLSQDFDLSIDGMDPLPLDEHGLDVREILDGFRKAIREVDRWDVIEEAQIGLFSFTKYLMWRDLRDRTDDLLKNAVVKHLVEAPTEAFPDQGAFPEPAELDGKYAPDQTLCPVSCDSSQLAAICSAGERKSFVLDGPPGTGKSQTITNIIAHVLAAGRSVLFVSEKMAALNVVHSRLQSVGLGPFCLELHSNKAHKAEVIRQLGEALDQTTERTSDEWNREAQRLGALRAGLNAQVEVLHRKRASEESLFQGLSKLIGLRETAKLPLSWTSPEAMDKGRLEDLTDLVERIEKAGQACGDPAVHPWRAVGAEELGPAFQADVEAHIKMLSAKCDELERAAAPIARLLGFSHSQWSVAGFKLVDELASLFASPKPVSMQMLTIEDFDRVCQASNDWAALINERAQLRQHLFPRYTDALLRMEHETIRHQLLEGEARWFLPRWSARRAVQRQLMLASQQPQKLSSRQMLQDLDDATRLIVVESRIVECTGESKQILGSLWSDSLMDSEGLAASLHWAGCFRALVSQLTAVDAAQSRSVQATGARLASELSDQLQACGDAGKIVARYQEATQAFYAARAALEQKLVLDPNVAWPSSKQETMIQTTRDVIDSWNASLPRLHGWCAWRRIRTQAISQSLSPLVEAYETGMVKCSDIRAVFRRGYYQWWCDAIIEAEPLLRDFVSPQFERRIQQFLEADRRYTELSRDEIRARLAAKAPSSSAQVSSKSEMGILLNLLLQKRPKMAIRTLLQKIPNLLPRIKPCMLMSPISVAQYLDAAHPPFDLVVFDEASQIPAWDAIGAIARGTNVIIAGDPKQLPPTSFFGRAETEEDCDEDTLQDLESVLDNCIAAQLPRCQLKWHYRSRHESLIAFSNREYYNGRLLTFPSPERRMAVSYRHVDGFYDRSVSRTNKGEAEAVADEIVRRLKDVELQNHTIGIVTFSMVQQKLIEDILDDRRRKSPEIEPFFGDDIGEPVFVKNLENVQGDERDVILFSICYGPDANQRVSMNFGPLNREGGERRLNVAVTRAREEVIVFSTLSPDHIDLAKTRARGVRDLKVFLDYAQRGEVALKEFATTNPDATYDSPFEEQVSDTIKTLGYTVHSQVGCSGYRIDLAVVDPEAPGRYLLGIECDGANYHSAKTARDRDRVRQGVLEDLGWRLHRVWSSDWWRDPKTEMTKISAAIEDARLKKNEPVRRKAPRVAATASAVASVSLACKTASRPKVNATVDQHDVYKAYSGSNRGTAESFYRNPSEAVVRADIAKIAECESPVSLGLVTRRVAGLWGIQRATSSVVDRVRLLAQTSEVCLVGGDEREFVWKRGSSPDAYDQFRVPGASEDSRRDAKDICPEEVANAVLHVLSEQGSMPRPDLIRETARLLGFQRVGQTVEKYMQAGIVLLEQRGSLTNREEMMVLQSETRVGSA